MIQYDRFAFASPPRTGTVWFRRAACMAGLGERGAAHVHTPPPGDHRDFVVAIVRHPYDWLVSMWCKLQGGCVGVPVVDAFAPAARSCDDHLAFVRRVVDENHDVAGVWRAYGASNVMRLEDLRWAAAELFESLGVARRVARRIAAAAAINATKNLPSRDEGLRRAVVQLEQEFCDAYDYS